MKKNSAQSTVGKVTTYAIVIFGILALGITGFLLSDAGRKFYEPKSEAAGYCSTYGTHSLGSCTNTLCTSSTMVGPNLGNKCASPNQKSGPKYTQCLIRDFQDLIVDCCQYGNPVNGVCPGGVTVTPTATATPTPTPTKIFCTIYKSYANNTCNNDTCATGRYCAQKALTGSVSGDGKLCQQPSTSNDNIIDCCPSGKVINSAGTACVIIGPTQTATPTPTPSPTKINCQTYSVWALNTCSNPTCSTASILRCVPKSVSGASEVKCANRTDGVDEIRDCCPSGKVLNSAKTACVTAIVTTVPATTVPPTTVPATTVPPTTIPITTAPPTSTPTMTTTVTTSPPTGSVTGTATPTLTASPTLTLPPTTSPTNGTPSVTHTPSETGFADDIIIYLGGALYVIGVLAFVLARYLGVSRKPIGRSV